MVAIAHNPDRLILGRYRLIERIDSGGMAVLFKASLCGAAGFEKEVAIKKVLPHLARDEEYVNMLRKEAWLCANLHHGNLVSVLDFLEDDGEYFLVMEYVDGMNLLGLLVQADKLGGRVPDAIAASIAHEVCKGLDYIHRKTGPDGSPLRIVHRDISPENILISTEGLVKIIDFGIAKSARRQHEASQTLPGIIRGKIAYISPEQVSGRKADHRSDVYAVGVVLYEMITNRLPFLGSTDMLMLSRIRRGEYPPPRDINPGISPLLGAIVRKAMAAKPQRRYQSAAEMADDLDAFLMKKRTCRDTTALARLARDPAGILNGRGANTKRRKAARRSEPESTRPRLDASMPPVDTDTHCPGPPTLIRKPMPS